MQRALSTTPISGLQAISAHRGRPLRALVLVAVTLAAGSPACGDDSTGGAGGTGANGGAGGAPSGGGGTGPVTSSTHSTSTGMANVPLGAECSTDAECGTGYCIKASDNDTRLGGGAPNGYCTMECASDLDCGGTTNLCVKDNDGVGECFLGCTIGEPPFQYVDSALDPRKCFGREDLRCQPIDMVPVCVPTCGSDSQCDGRVCDPRYGACVDTANTGKAFGDKCDPNAANPECAGVCVNFSSGESMCSSRCVLGGELEGFDCGGITSGLCVFRPADNGAGDYGFCTPACNAQDDCQNPDFWCFGNNFATNGYCFGATACPNGAADCTDANTTCTVTKYGPFCLDPQFPLGDAGVGGGGVGGGGVGGAGGAGGATGGGGTGGIVP
ncbi:MAG: hypothetical protein U0271_04380 [Polyangiaceae bacterium]